MDYTLRNPLRWSALPGRIHSTADSRCRRRPPCFSPGRGCRVSHGNKKTRSDSRPGFPVAV